MTRTRRGVFGMLAGGALMPLMVRAQEWDQTDLKTGPADRAALVAAEARAQFSDLPEGTVVTVGPSHYRRATGARDIPDLPNWRPEGMVSVLHFGAVGDCDAAGKGRDDHVAVQHALTWWIGADYRKLTFPAGRRYRLGAPVLAHLDGQVGRVGNMLVMEGPVTPDPGIGTAISLKGFRHGHFRVRGYQGGQDADYRLEAPKGGDTLLRIDATRRCKVDVEVVDYAGRVVYVGRGGAPYKQSFIDLAISTGDIATLAGAHPVGQMIYARGTSAWGSLHGNGAWETYGSVFDSIVDLRIDALKLGTKNPDAPVRFLGCGSIWIDALLTGDETHRADLLHFVPNAAGAGCRRIHISRCFAVGPKRALVVRDTDPREYGIRIDHLETRDCSGPALVLDGVSGADINHSSQEDAHSVVVRGRSTNIHLELNSYNSARESLWIGPEARDVQVTGLSQGAGRDTGQKTDRQEHRAAADNRAVAAVRVDTSRPVFFNSFHTRGKSTVASFDLVVDNDVTILGGRYEAGTFRNGVLARQIRNARGLKTEARGRVTLPAGQRSVTVAHGLLAAPDIVTATAHQSMEPNVQIRVAAMNTRTFVLELTDSASVEETTVFYSAAMRQALGP